MTSKQTNPSAGELLQRLTDTAGGLLRQELHQGRKELKEQVQQGAPGAAMLAGAAVLGAASIGASTALVVRLLDRALPPPAAAAVAAAALGGGSAALALAGLARLREVNPVPEQTLRSIQDDVAAVTQPGENSTAG